MRPTPPTDEIHFRQRKMRSPRWNGASERSDEWRGCAIKHARHSRHLGPVGIRGSLREHRQLREIQEIVVMTRPIRQIFSWLMTRKRFCS